MHSFFIYYTAIRDFCFAGAGPDDFVQAKDLLRAGFYIAGTGQADL